mmetsp:Transcript_16865/g.47328  ORF Transcript_16865/g.47328 Transcript_16865/m.47328 type:complete len:272 (+) Transcript_16865:2236-3051(+)
MGNVLNVHGVIASVRLGEEGMALQDEPFELLEDVVHRESENDVGRNDGRQETERFRGDVGDGDLLDRVGHVAGFFGAFGCGINRHQPNGVDDANHGQLESKLQHPDEAKGIHSALLQKFGIADKVQLPQPGQETELIICQMGLQIFHVSAQVVHIGILASHVAEYERHDCEQGAVDPQRVAQDLRVLAFDGFRLRGRRQRRRRRGGFVLEVSPGVHGDGCLRLSLCWCVDAFVCLRPCVCIFCLVVLAGLRMFQKKRNGRRRDILVRRADC